MPSVMVRLFERRRSTAAQHDVEAIAERPFRLGGGEVEFRDQPRPGTRVGNRIEDRVEGKQRIAGKIQLGDQAGEE